MTHSDQDAQDNPIPGQGRYRVKPGRLALVCTACRTRVYGDPTWRCAGHPGKTVAQINRRYMGQDVPTPHVEGLGQEDPGEFLRPNRHLS